MSFDTNSNRYDFTVFILSIAFVLSVLVVATAVYNTNHLKADAQLIRQAIEQKSDLHEVRCLLNPNIAACDTVSLVKELRVDPRFAPRQVPTVTQPETIQP